MVDENDGLGLKEVADFYALILEGSTPELDEDVYVFVTEDAEGERSLVAVGELNRSRHVLISLSGDPEAPGVDYILDSLQDR